MAGGGGRPEDLGDADLVTAAQRGDRVALDVLLRRHHDRVAGLCRRMCGPADGPDATQEALVAVVRGLPRFDGRSAFGTWVYRVATNACLDELRRRARRPRPGLEEDEVPARSGPLTGPGPLDPADAVSATLDVDAALAQLPAEFRAAVVLRDLCDLDYATIAEVLDLPPGTVRSRIARGRAALADSLAAGGGGEADRRPRNQRPSPRRPRTQP